MEFIDEVRRETGFVCGEFNTGGGLGIAYKVKDEPSTVAEYAEQVVSNVKRMAAKLDLPLPRILCEPGSFNRRLFRRHPVHRRHCQGAAGDRHLCGRRRRHVGQPAAHALRRRLRGGAGEQAGLATDTTVTVVGKHCESGDVLVKASSCRVPRSATS